MTTTNPNGFGEAPQDKLVLYASLFMYNPKAKRAEFSSYCPNLDQFECNPFQFYSR